MTDDELTARLRRTLDDHAATVHAPDDAWERFQQHAPTPLAHAHRGRWYGATAGVLAAAAAIAVAVVVSRGSSSHPTTTAVAAAPTTASTANAAVAPFKPAHPPTTAHPPEAALPAASGAATATIAPPPAAPAFQPVSVTFVSPSEGWVLGAAACAVAPCPTLRHTVDGGRTWSVAIGPPAGQIDHLRFADATDGWAWGRTALWSTHDGGISWTPVSIPGLATAWMVEDLEASAGVAHVAVTQDDGTVRLADTPVGSDSWVLAPVRVTLGAGPVPSGQLVLQGSVGWFVQVDRVVIAGARLRGGTWGLWTPPCATVEGPATLAATSPTELVAACDVGLWSTPKGEELFVSHDGGTTWADVGRLPLTGVSAIASAAPSTIAIAGVGPLPQIDVSFDGGRTWSSVFGMAQGSITDLGFTTTSQGVAVLLGPGGGPGGMVTTHDGGHSWTTVTFP